MTSCSLFFAATTKRFALEDVYAVHTQSRICTIPTPSTLVHFFFSQHWCACRLRIDVFFLLDSVGRILLRLNAQLTVSQTPYTTQDNTPPRLFLNPLGYVATRMIPKMSGDMFPSSSRRKNSNAALLETDTLGAVEQSSLDNLSRGGVILCRFGAPALLAFSTRWISVQQRQLQQSNIFLQVTWYCFPVGYGKPRFRDKEREGKRERERERERGSSSSSSSS